MPFVSQLYRVRGLGEEPLVRLQVEELEVVREHHEALVRYDLLVLLLLVCELFEYLLEPLFVHPVVVRLEAAQDSDELGHAKLPRRARGCRLR